MKSSCLGNYPHDFFRLSTPKLLKSKQMLLIVTEAPNRVKAHHLQPLHHGLFQTFAVNQ